MIAAIDLGTSSVKVLVTENGKTVKKAKRTYNEKSVSGWLSAVCEALIEITENTDVDAIALSSQVGTYIINGKDVISWQDAVGKAEVEKVKSDF